MVWQDNNSRTTGKKCRVYGWPWIYGAKCRIGKSLPKKLLAGATPRLIDEWQLAPQLWDAARLRLTIETKKDSLFSQALPYLPIRIRYTTPVQVGLHGWRWELWAFTSQENLQVKLGRGFVQQAWCGYFWNQQSQYRLYSMAHLSWRMAKSHHYKQRSGIGYGVQILWSRCQQRHITCW